jgi:hypothetical protein
MEKTAYRLSGATTPIICIYAIFPEKETRQKEGTFFTEKCSVAFYFQYTLFKIGIICEF